MDRCSEQHDGGARNPPENRIRPREDGPENIPKSAAASAIANAAHQDQQQIRNDDRDECQRTRLVSAARCQRDCVYGCRERQNHRTEQEVAAQ